MRRIYIISTLIVIILTLLTVTLGWMVLPMAFIFPPVLPILFSVMVNLPTLALLLLCGLPAILMMRWPVAAVGALAVGAWLFSYTTFLAPQRAQAAQVALSQALQSAPSAPLGPVIHAEIQNGGNYPDFSCRTLCQSLLIDVGAQTVRVRGTSPSSAVTFRLGKGDACAGRAARYDPCILLTRNTDQTPDVVIKVGLAGQAFGDINMGALGIYNRDTWMVVSSDGRTFGADPGALLPAMGWRLEPAWMQGGLEQLDQVGLVRARSSVGGKAERAIPFLQRLGVNVKEQKSPRNGKLRDAITPQSREDALQGPLPSRVKRILGS